jgi:hypothetical protein
MSMSFMINCKVFIVGPVLVSKFCRDLCISFIVLLVPDFVVS